MTPSLRCPVCRSEIPDSDYSVDRTWARCRPCDARFAVEDGIGPAPAGLRRPELPRPAGIDEERLGGSHLSLGRPWCSWPNRIAIVAVLVGSGFYLSQLPIDLWGKLTGSPTGQFLALVSLLPLYGLAAFLINETAIEVGPGHLRVVHGPLPCGGDQVIPADQVDQLYTKRIRRRVRHLAPNQDRRWNASWSLGSDRRKWVESIQVHYELRLRCRDGREHVVVGNLATPEQALYMEQEVERTLGITDQTIPGELDRAWVPEEMISQPPAG